MQSTFQTACNLLDTLLHAGEHYLAWFEGEHSDFVRFNHAEVRQAGSVKQMFIDVRLIVGSRHISGKVPLSGDETTDNVVLKELIARLRKEAPYLPEDPYLLYSTNAEQSSAETPGKLPSATEALAQITTAAKGLDLVGIYAGGPICRGFGSSFGSRRWHATQSFNFDFSLYLSGDKAVKSGYAGFEWDGAELAKKISDAQKQLTILERPIHSLSPGKHRVYLAPSATAEILQLMSWGGFGVKSQRTRQSALLRLIEGEASFSPQLSITENTVEGITANFESQGFAKPDAVPLISNGKMASALVSPRSAKEFGLATTGANAGESPEALDMAAGDIPIAEVLQRLGTGIYINNLWYLSYSDRSAGRMTGMTRFAAFWVENGEIAAPVNVMRFDESMYRMFGENLEGLTKEREYQIDPSSYGARSTQSWRLPGALIRDFTLTL